MDSVVSISNILVLLAGILNLKDSKFYAREASLANMSVSMTDRISALHRSLLSFKFDGSAYF